MRMHIRAVFLAACIAALVPVGMPTAQAKAQIKECSATPSSQQGHLYWRMIDGRKCWYAGKALISKSLLQWPAAAHAQAKARVDAVSAQAKVKVETVPVSVATENRSDPMDAQARMLDYANSFEARWRARVITE